MRKRHHHKPSKSNYSGYVDFQKCGVTYLEICECGLGRKTNNNGEILEVGEWKKMSWEET